MPPAVISDKRLVLPSTSHFRAKRGRQLLFVEKSSSFLFFLSVSSFRSFHSIKRKEGRVSEWNVIRTGQ